MPKLAKRIAEGQAYVSQGPGGRASGYLNEGEFVTSSRKLPDGSLVQHTPEGAKTTRRILERGGHSEESILESLRKLESSPENTQVTLAEGLEAIKWSVKSIEPALNGPLLCPLIPLKSAYEFLALHLNSAIYCDLPALSATRSALTGGNLDAAQLAIERLHANNEKPIHGVLFEGNSPYAKVQVRLFGELAFRVHFKTLSVGGPQFIYTHDLESNTEHAAQTSAGEQPI